MEFLEKLTVDPDTLLIIPSVNSIDYTKKFQKIAYEIEDTLKRLSSPSINKQKKETKYTDFDYSFDSAPLNEPSMLEQNLSPEAFKNHLKSQLKTAAQKLEILLNDISTYSKNIEKNPEEKNTLKELKALSNKYKPLQKKVESFL